MQVVVISILSIPIITFVLIGLSLIFKKKKRRPKLILHQGGKK